MANSPSARKRARQAVRATERNTAQKSRVRTFVKKVLKLVADGKKKEAAAAYRDAQSALDSSVRRNHFHKNNVARTKKRLNQKIKAL